MQLKFYGIEHLSQLWLHFLALIFQNSNWLGKDDSLIPIILHSPLLTPVKNRVQSVSSFGVFLTDQSGESATELQTHWLRRVRGTCLQTELPFTERLVKLDDAFEASLKISDHKYEGEKQAFQLNYKNKTYNLYINLIGKVQLKNILMAMLAAENSKINF